ncbi:hypothetical protein COLSTE_00458 [Collinsella stercoris DSM 13279]|uniref:Type I restriction modification DNA specificity domain-containing protein n=2 Tax=Collinsella TaxID=102106 RepID=B6G8R7_9ACTN|nr:hypothetical protein COLSTE_00458 [Collinsella stercoris DSM 13279]
MEQSMLDICACLQQRQVSEPTRPDDVLLESLLNSGQDEVFCILPTPYFERCTHKRIRAIKTEWHLLCSIDLNSILPGTAAKYTLYGLSITPKRTVCFAQWLRRGIFNEPGNYHWVNDGIPCGPSSPAAGKPLLTYLPEDYKSYLQNCERFVNTGIAPQGDDFAEYTLLDSSDLIEDKWMPAFYKQEHLEMRRKLRSEHTVPLAEIAEVRTAHFGHFKQNVPTLTDVSFPPLPKNIQLGMGSDVELQHGDVILSTCGKHSHAIVYNGSSGVYARRGLSVLRPVKDVSPEYLCLYLTSDFALGVFDALDPIASHSRHISKEELKLFPVVLPTLDERYYRAEYAKLANPQQRDYISLERLRTGQLTDVESILDAEIARKIQAHNDEQLREFLTSDLRELNTCFAHGAYKAAIILAGSILEAVLTDWLSEIHGTNFFENDYMIETRNGHCRQARLSDMINEIRELEKPDWLEEAKLAHKIRKKRNLVHATLCVKADDVNEQTARMVIEYLDRVLRTRGASCLEQVTRNEQ